MLLCGVLTDAAAQELPGMTPPAPAPASNPVTDPARLAADGWTYFSPTVQPLEEQVLTVRIAAAHTALEAVAATLDPLDPERRDRLTTLITRSERRRLDATLRGFNA